VPAVKSGASHPTDVGVMLDGAGQLIVSWRQHSVCVEFSLLLFEGSGDLP